jgi:hypothetical protein
VTRKGRGPRTSGPVRSNSLVFATSHRKAAEPACTGKSQRQRLCATPLDACTAGCLSHPQCLAGWGDASTPFAVISISNSTYESAETERVGSMLASTQDGKIEVPDRIFSFNSIRGAHMLARNPRIIPSNPQRALHRSLWFWIATLAFSVVGGAQQFSCKSPTRYEHGPTHVIS